jgi:outer membrane biosynthesis protein TonB
MSKKSITFEDLNMVAEFINSLDEIEDKIEIPDGEVEGEGLIIFATAIVEAGQDIPEEVEAPDEIIDLYDALVDQYDQKSGVFEGSKKEKKKEKAKEVTPVKKEENNKKGKVIPMKKEETKKEEKKKVEPKKEEKKVETKKAAPKKEEKKRGPIKAVGIVAFIKAALEKGPVTKDKIWQGLVKKFPEREAEGMKKTVNVQIYRLGAIKKDNGYILNSK